MGINLNTNTSWANIDFGGPTGGAEGPQGPVFGDGMTSIRGLLIDFNYTQGTNSPLLPSPLEGLNEQVPTPGSPGSNGLSLPTEHLQGYADSVASQLEQAATLYGLTEDQVQMLAFALLTGDPIPDDTFLNDLLGPIEAKVGEEMLETFGEDAFPSLRDQAKAVKDKGMSTLNSAQEQLDQLQDYVNELPDGAEKEKLQNFIDQARNNFGTLSNNLAKFDDVSNRQQLGELMSQINKDIANLKGQMGDVHSLSNDPNIGARLYQLAGTINTGFETFSDSIAQAKLNNQLAQGDWSHVNNDLGELYLKFVESSSGLAFDAVLTRFATENNLSEEQVAQLRFAHFNPEAVTDPNIKSMLSEIHVQVMTMVSETLGVPPSFFPNIDNMHFNVEIEMAFDDAFLAMLEGADLETLAQNLGISQADVKGMIEFLHFNPELTKELVNNNEQLKKLLGIDNEADFETLLEKLKELEGGAMSEIAPKYGLPPGYIISSSNVIYQGKLNGRFLQQFDYNLRYSDPALTQDQINNIKSALADPLNPNITAETKNLIQQLYTQTVEQIKSEFNLPVGWVPPVTLIGQMGNIPIVTRIMWSATEQISDTMEIMAKLVDAMPDNPSKALLVNVMKIVSEAIAELKVRIAELQILDSQMATKFSEANKDAALYKVQLNKDKIRKMQKKKAKMKGKMKQMEPLIEINKAMKVIGPGMKVAGLVASAIFLVALAIMLGPVVLAAAIVWVALLAATIQEIATEKDYMTMMFDEMREALPDGAAMALSLVIICSVCLFANGPFCFMWFGELAEKAKIAETFIGLFTDNIYAKAVVSGVANAATQSIMALIVAGPLAIFAAALAILASVASAGSGTVVAVAGKVAVKVLKALGEALKQLTKLLRALLKMLQKLIQMSQKAMKLVMKVLNQLMKVADKVKSMADKLAKKLINLNNLEKLYKIGKFSKKIAKKIQKAAEQLEKHIRTKIIKELKELVTKPLEKFQSFAEKFKMVADTTTSIINAHTSFVLADIAKINARYDSEIEMLEGLIKVLKKVLQKIFDQIEAQGNWMVELGNLQSKMWSDLTQTASTVAGANEA